MRPSDHESESALPREGWILYDGGCGCCFRWVHFWKKVVEQRGFALKDLQSAYADGTLRISKENLLNHILILTRVGKLESGANAYLFVVRQIWWHGLSTQSSVCRVSIGYFGGAIVGSIEIDTEFLAIVPCPNKPAPRIFRRPVSDPL
jgi:hypothetical protein